MPTVEHLNYNVLDDHGWDIGDDDLFEKASNADLDEEDYGTFEVDGNTNILVGAEMDGHDWPFSCRAGSCANCAAILKDGEIEMEPGHILHDDEVEEKNIRLTCIGTAQTDHVKIIYNAKHLDYLRDRVL